MKTIYGRYSIKTCDKYHIVHDNDKVFEYLRTYEEKDKCEQLSLFDFI